MKDAGRVFLAVIVSAFIASCATSGRRTACIVHRDTQNTTYERIIVVREEVEPGRAEVLFPDANPPYTAIIDSSSIEYMSCPSILYQGQRTMSDTGFRAADTR